MSLSKSNVLALIICFSALSLPVLSADLSECDQEELDMLMQQVKRGYWTIDEVVSHCQPGYVSSRNKSESRSGNSDPRQSGCAGILGSYDFGNWAGILRVWREEGDLVKGTYGKTGENSVTGTLTGNVLKGSYTNKEANREGTFELTFSPQSDGSRTVTGTWWQTSPSASDGSWGRGKQRCP